MNSNNQRIIDRIRRAWHESRRVAAVRRRQAREEAERAAAEFQLAVDDVVAEGLDPLSPLGQEALLAIARSKKRPTKPEGYESALSGFIDDNEQTGDF